MEIKKNVSSYSLHYNLDINSTYQSGQMLSRSIEILRIVG
jgi:hypothetical protein